MARAWGSSWGSAWGSSFGASGGGGGGGGSNVCWGTSWGSSWGSSWGARSSAAAGGARFVPGGIDWWAHVGKREEESQPPFEPQAQAIEQPVEARSEIAIAKAVRRLMAMRLPPVDAPQPAEPELARIVDEELDRALEAMNLAMSRHHRQIMHERVAHAIAQRGGIAADDDELLMLM